MKKMIHVLQISKSTGGVGQDLRTLVTNLDKERFRVTVICLSEGGDELAAELSKLNGVRAYSMQMDRYRISCFLICGVMSEAGADDQTGKI